MTREEFIRLVVQDVESGNIRMAKGRIGNFASTTPSFKPEDEKLLRSITEELWHRYPVLKEPCDESKYERKGKLNIYTADDWSYAVLALQENCCPERLEDVIKIGKALYGTRAVDNEHKSASKPRYEPELKVEPINAEIPKFQREKTAPQMSSPEIKKERKKSNLLLVLVIAASVILVVVLVVRFLKR